MTTKIESLEIALRDVLGDRIQSLTIALGQATLVVGAADYWNVMRTLRDHDDLHFEELIAMSGVDYLNYGDGSWTGLRFAATTELLSIKHNRRLRVRAFAPDDAMPTLPTVSDLWASANWFEREAFDLVGIIFEGHTDLRRILTDYGFIGHPFRKDFPVSGYVEMRYDPVERRVIYQPVTIEPREVTPRVIREDNYGNTHG